MKNIYKLNSDIITEDEFVVAEDIATAINLYVERFKGQNVSEKNITKIERIALKCLIS